MSTGIVYEKIKENVLNELKKTFNPEFLNRVDEIVVFHPLEKEHLMSIIDLLVKETNRVLLDQELVIEVSQEVKEWIISRYYQPDIRRETDEESCAEGDRRPVIRGAPEGKIQGRSQDISCS